MGNFGRTRYSLFGMSALLAATLLLPATAASAFPNPALGVAECGSKLDVRFEDFYSLPWLPSIESKALAARKARWCWRP